MKTQTEVKRILDYGYYCDLVELNNGDLRIDINEEQKANILSAINPDEGEKINPEDFNELDTFPYFFDHFDYLEFIGDLAYDDRFGALTNSCAIYEPETKRLWWYPNYQIHNIFQKLMEDKEVTFSLADDWA